MIDDALGSPTPLPPAPNRHWRRRGHGRLVVTVVMPVLALLAFGSYVVAGALKDYHHDTEMQAAAQLARKAHLLAHDLRTERGQAVEWLASARPGERGGLEAGREATNADLARFRRELMQPQVVALMGGDSRRIDLGEIDAVRGDVDGESELVPVLAGYNRLIAGLLSASARMPVSDIGGFSAYTDLAAIGDRMALAEAIGQALMAAPAARPQLMPLLIEAHAEARAFCQQFALHANAPRWDDLRAAIEGAAGAEIERLTETSLHGRMGDRSAWHHAHRELIDRLERAEEDLVTDIDADLDHRLATAKGTFAMVLLAALALVGLALETLRRSEQRAITAEDTSRMLFRAVEQSPVAVMITDPTGRIEYVNDAFAAMTGFAAIEVIGDNPRIQRSLTTPGAVFDEMWRTIASGREWRGEICNRRKDGSLYWESMTVAPVHGVSGEIVNYIALKEDVSDRRAAEAAQAAAHQAAELANRAKSEFLAAMSHELRTPLNAIIGFSDIMAAEPYGEIAPQYREYLDDINLSGRNLLQLINDILDIARLDVGRLDLREDGIDVETLARSAVTMVRERAEAGAIALKLSLEADLPPLWVDARRIKQALVNLLANAVKFTPKGGKIEIAAARSAEGGIRITIADSGIGIAPDKLAQVMTPFVQADTGMTRRYEGSGLGLPLARQLVELHGGTLTLDSTLGEGTVVTVTLPPERVRRSAPDPTDPA